MPATILGGAARPEARQLRLRTWRRAALSAVLVAATLAASGIFSQRSLGTAAALPPESEAAAPGSVSTNFEGWLRNVTTRAAGGHRGPKGELWRPCAVNGGSCHCVGTLVFSTALGVAVREVNADGEVQCTAEALGSNMHRDLRICWCQDGLPWGDDVRKGLAAMVKNGLVPRVEIAAEDDVEPDCSPESDGLWHGCVMMSRRWDTTVVPQILTRAAPPEEQLDMTLRKLDACHRLAPGAPLRVLGVRSGQGSDALELPISTASVCSVVYAPEQGAIWTAKTKPLHCATEPGTCTTTPCECRRASDTKLQLHTPQGRKCWACAEAGKEYRFRVNALAETMGGGSVSWWPPSGINCPPILWIFMDWRQVMAGCPVVFGYMVVFFGCLMIRRFEEISGGMLPWTRVIPLFGPALKRGEVWRFFTFTFFHLQFLELFQNLLTLLDTLDVEGTPAIVLGDGSNLKCGVGAKQNFMCYPSIGIGSYHTLGVALLSAAVGGMCSTWITFKSVVTGASALGFGLSGAIVALYGLYAGADLDQATSVQRSFQDWVWLRLIFVAFHVGMEWIRGVSQKDLAGLFAHTASFAAGFGYVLYFLPPMGDGTLLAADRPYIVPCAYDFHAGQYADSSVPECIRLFSQLYEYQVPAVRNNCLLLFGACVAFTALNIVVLQSRVPSSEAMLLAGLEVSAICVPRKGGGQQPSWRSSNLEGKSIIFWCEVMTVGKLRPPPEGNSFQPLIEVRVLETDPRTVAGRLVDQAAEASGRTRSVEGGESADFRESIFLPVKFKKGNFVQLVLRDGASEQKVALGQTALPLSQGLRFRRGRDFSEQKLRLMGVGDRGAAAEGATVLVRFRCFDLGEMVRFRSNVKKELDNMRMTLRFYQEQLTALEAGGALEETAAN